MTYAFDEPIPSMPSAPRPAPSPALQGDNPAGRAPALLTVRLDAIPALHDLELLAKAAQRSTHIRQRLLGLGDLRFELSRIQGEDLLAVPAGDVVLCLELADGLRDLAAAVRAGEFDAV